MLVIGKGEPKVTHMEALKEELDPSHYYTHMGMPGPIQLPGDPLVNAETAALGRSNLINKFAFMIFAKESSWEGTGQDTLI